MRVLPRSGGAEPQNILALKGLTLVFLLSPLCTPFTLSCSAFTGSQSLTEVGRDTS